MKRVLFVSYLFPPMAAGGVPRVAQFCKYLPEFDWEPTVLTGPLVPAADIDREALRQLPDCVEVVRAPCPLGAQGVRGSANPRSGLAGLARRAARLAMRLVLVPDRQILWKRNAVRAGLAALAAKKHAVILATFGPGTNLLVGRELARRSGLPLVLDFRDLWADLPQPAFATPLHRALASRMERRAVAAAGKVVAVSENMAAHLAERHGRRRKDVVSITNGFDPTDLARAKDEREEAGRPFRICYTGSVYGGYDLGPFFGALSDLSRDRIIGSESFRAEFAGNLPAQEIRRWGLEGLVESRPYVPHSEVFEVMARADVLLLIEAPGYWAQFSYAAKIFDYLLTGKPVLALVESGGNSARLLERAGVGHIADPGNRDGIRRALEGLLSFKGAPPRPVDISREPLADFDRRRLAGKLAHVLGEAVRQ